MKLDNLKIKYLILKYIKNIFLTRYQFKNIKKKLQKI